MAKIGLVLGPLLALAGFSGCGNEASIDETAVTTQAALSADAIIHQTGQSLGFTTSSDGTLKRSLSATNASASNVMAPIMADGVPAAMMRAIIGPTATANLTGTAMPTMLTAGEQADQTGTEIRRLMQERLFIASNLESKSGGTATYWLRADPTCRPLPADSDPPGTLPPIASTCADDLTKVEVRIAVEADGDGARFTLLIGPPRLELVAFIIHSDELAAEVGLASAKAAADYINQQLGNSVTTTSYDRLAGRMRWSVQKVTATKVTFSASILESIDVATTGGGEITSAAADPAVALTGDAADKTAELRLAVGATTVDGTWDPHATGVANRDLHLSIGGWYGAFDLDDTAKQITWTDAGIGETKIGVRSDTIFDLNLNADSMRRFSGKMLVNVDNTLHIEASPKVDFNLALDYDAIASDLSSPPNTAFAHETYDVALVNSSSAAIIETVASTATFSGGFRIVAGTLTIGAASVPAETVTVPAGKCLSTQSMAAPGANPILGVLVVGDCP